MSLNFRKYGMLGVGAIPATLIVLAVTALILFGLFWSPRQFSIRLIPLLMLLFGGAYGSASLWWSAVNPGRLPPGHVAGLIIGIASAFLVLTSTVSELGVQWQDLHVFLPLSAPLLLPMLVAMVPLWESWRRIRK